MLSVGNTNLCSGSEAGSYSRLIDFSSSFQSAHQKSPSDLAQMLSVWKTDLEDASYLSSDASILGDI